MSTPPGIQGVRWIDPSVPEGAGATSLRGKGAVGRRDAAVLTDEDDGEAPAGPRISFSATG